MNTEELVWKLSLLMHLDSETSVLYREAVRAVGEHDVAEQLKAYGAEHERHAAQLRDEIVRLERRPSPPTVEFEMFIAEYRDAVASAKRQDVMLLRLRSLEKATVLQYSEALDADVPAPTAELVRRGYEDERRHLRFIELTLDVIGATAVARS